MLKMAIFYVCKPVLPCIIRCVLNPSPPLEHPRPVSVKISELPKNPQFPLDNPLALLSNKSSSRGAFTVKASAGAIKKD